MATTMHHVWKICQVNFFIIIPDLPPRYTELLWGTFKLYLSAKYNKRLGWVWWKNRKRKGESSLRGNRDSIFVFDFLFDIWTSRHFYSQKKKRRKYQYFGSLQLFSFHFLLLSSCLLCYFNEIGHRHQLVDFLEEMSSQREVTQWSKGQIVKILSNIDFMIVLNSVDLCHFYLCISSVTK